MQFDVLKYNYNNTKHYNSVIKVEDNKLYYKRKKGQFKVMNDLLGIVHGPITYTWRVLFNKHKTTDKYHGKSQGKSDDTTFIYTLLCVSFVTRERTYDFLFKLCDDLKMFFVLTKPFVSNSDYLGFKNRKLHRFTVEYFNYSEQLFTEEYNWGLNGYDNWLNICIRKRWNMTINAPYQNVSRYNELDSPVKNMSANTTCCICLCDFSDNEICQKLMCNHVMHLKCMQLLYKSDVNNKCPYCRETIE